MAMVEADLIDPSVDPSMLRVKPESPGRYIPEVFYAMTNKYGAQEQKAANPCFPVEYWLVTVGEANTCTQIGLCVLMHFTFIAYAWSTIETNAILH
jgi:hypothetical protein